MIKCEGKQNPRCLMRRAILGLSVSLFSFPAAAEYWVADRLEGYSATSFADYKFIEDSFSAGMRICFDGDSGSVTGNDLPLLRIGESTLLGYSTNQMGLETVNVYQIDRANRTLLFTQSRIGTSSVTTALPDYAATFIGTVRRDGAD